jgi:hypothetical protein
LNLRRVHEWAFGDVGRRTVCGNGRPLEVVTDLGLVALERRCRNCARLRAAFGTSSKVCELGPEAPSAALTEVAAAAAEQVLAELDERSFGIMMHATGWQSRWPLFRNYFCTGEGGDDWAPIQKLVELGLMRVGREPSPLSGGDTVFCVTAIGIAALKGRGKAAKRSEQTG